MPTPRLPDDVVQQAAAVYIDQGIKAGAEILGIGRHQMDRRVDAAVERGFLDRRDRVGGPNLVKPKDMVAESLDRVRLLETQLKVAQRESLTDDYVRRKIIKLAEAPLNPPDWLLTPKKVRSGVIGVPTLFASDLHWGEVVDPKQINGVNSFDIEIAQRRARRLIERAVALLRQHMVNPNYPGIVFALGGDMVSGDIHEELSETNELQMMPALIDLFGVLSWCIATLADEFGRVFIPCVTGNHGRNTKKPRAKGRNYSNFDWLLYNFLAKRFESDSRVTFMIPNGPDAHFTIYGHRYCMTHGDQFRGGDGMIGALGPILRGDHKKRTMKGQIDMEYDTLMMGHWHQLIQLMRVIVNGSLKGYDEYAASNNFGFEIPRQGLWITHPEHGITFSMPVNLEDPLKRASRSWVSVPE